MDLRFSDKGTFKVLQMADIQDGPNVNDDTIRLIQAAIDYAKPDLVVLTGDQIRGYDPAYIDTFLRRRGEKPGANIRAVTKLEAKVQHIEPSPEGDEAADRLMDKTREKVRETFSAFLGPVVAAKVPFAATYGNHDFQCGILTNEQDDLYRELPGCLNPNIHPDEPSALAKPNPLACEPGTFAIPVASSDGERIAMSVMMVNSGDYAEQSSDDAEQSAKHTEQSANHPELSSDRTGQSPNFSTANEDNGHNSAHSSAAAPTFEDYSQHSRKLDLTDSDGYGTPSPEAVQWLQDVQAHLGEMNGDGEPVPAIAFQHIPPQEFVDALLPVPAWTPYAVEGTRNYAGQCYVLDKAVCRPGSQLGEFIGCADTNCGEVAAMRKAGGYFALFSGHDHKNDFVAHVDSLDLGYAPTCGFTSYGPKSALRGIRLFTFYESDPTAYQTRMLTWAELIGEPSQEEVRVFIGDHLVTDGASARNELRRPPVAATLALTAAGVAHMIWHGLRRLFRRDKR